MANKIYLILVCPWHTGHYTPHTFQNTMKEAVRYVRANGFVWRKNLMYWENDELRQCLRIKKVLKVDIENGTKI